jgi:hypothetical protein
MKKETGVGSRETGSTAKSQELRAVVLLFCSLFPALAQNPDRAQRVIDDALAALGGKQYLAMQDRVEKGRSYSFYREKISGLSETVIYTRYLIRPEPPTLGFFGLRERQAFGKYQDAGAVLLTETAGYDITFRGARPWPKDQWERFVDTTRRNVLYIFRQRLGEPGLAFFFRGSDVFQNQPVDMVDISDADNNTVTVYFHQSSKLPVYQSFRRRNPATGDRDEEVTIFSRYRDVGNGVQWPHSIHRERNGEKIFELFSAGVEINKNLKDDLFTLPSGMKVLPYK